MNKRLIEKFKKLNLPLGEYVIFGSGPMVVRGLKSSNDLDILVSDEVFEKYAKEPGWNLKKSCFGDDLLENDDIEFLTVWKPGEWNRRELMENAEIIDGLAFARLEDVLRWKKIWNREKDKKDIEKIETYLNENRKNAF